MTPADIRRELDRGMPHEDHPEIVHRLWGCLEEAAKIAAGYKAAVDTYITAKLRADQFSTRCGDCPECYALTQRGAAEWTDEKGAYFWCQQHAPTQSQRHWAFIALDDARERMVATRAVVAEMLPEAKQ